MKKAENQEVKEYLIYTTSNILDGCEVFTRVFGENFARNSLEKNLNSVYTNVNKGNFEAYSNYENNYIIICSDKGEFLAPKDIEKDKRLKQKTVHEGAHMALKKSQEECEANGTKAETGMSTVLKNGKEIGVGLDEGLIVWILKKAGFPTRRF